MIGGVKKYKSKEPICVPPIKDPNYIMIHDAQPFPFFIGNRFVQRLSLQTYQFLILRHLLGLIFMSNYLNKT